MPIVEYSDGNGKYHTHLCAGDVGEVCFLPGAPGRVDEIAARFDEGSAHVMHDDTGREFFSVGGTLDGHQVSVVSTGMGDGSATECLEEAIECGGKAFVRVGTCGGVRLDVCGGDVVIAMSATHSGASLEYAGASYPPTADWELTRALADAADALGIRHHVGVVHCKSAYRSQHEPGALPNHVALSAAWDACVREGVLASEMESASLFCVGSFRRVRVATVLSVVANQMRGAEGLPNEQVHDTSSAIDVAIEGARLYLAGSHEAGAAALTAVRHCH